MPETGVEREGTVGVMGEFCAPASTEHGHLSVISAATSTFASVPSVTCGYVFIRGWSEMLACVPL